MLRPRLVSVLTFVSLAGLSACGFTPLYGDAGAGSSLSRIAVTTQDDRLGYRVREQLEDALGRDGSREPLWRLQTTIEQSRRPLGRRIDDTATRYELTVRGAWTLTPTGGGAAVTGVETVTTTYASADQPYAAIAAQQDGEERAAAELARLIRLDLLRALSARP
ncbi:MAG: LPS assembly lipoprotein LptE [Brevundimonas sp.]|uniref:LPS assembly lipoprotein LptE n=1 Tax=Brevundimonas sp. TaxID=1871086 RepID=UPI002721C015|nr:LPS assembly lipoprotein LptE [Brevundimonas sp.]MDO9586556.1 LPS assembly lipoprotein LptE [Brevundimonas sp.]MDP3657481.1 LPS assembly lipoprotein LptE [Brevundimonas sp.]MDZ4112551.1 LPS assembly lipoprotein LptE [Brevundimonas sp.]